MRSICLDRFVCGSGEREGAVLSDISFGRRVDMKGIHKCHGSYLGKKKIFITISKAIQIHTYIHIHSG
jgi:hypothetical protein